MNYLCGYDRINVERWIFRKIFTYKWSSSFHIKKHGEYLKFLYNFYRPYINTKPACIKVYNKKTDERLKFKTISLPPLL